MHWRIKGLVQKVLSTLPHGTHVNDMLQRTVGGLRDFDRQVASKVQDWAIFVEHLAGLGISPSGLRLFEIGTGWFPTLPVCFALAGAASCETFDLNNHLNLKLTRRMLAALEGLLPKIAAASKRPIAKVVAEYRTLTAQQTVGGILDAARVRYHAPADASKTSLPDGSMDLVFSNSVFEHVPPAVIADMMRESRRLLRTGGVAIHCVNCGDHYAYVDRGITPLNYLTYPTDRWRLWNNELLYQNRMRPSDFRDLAERAGLEVVLDHYRPRSELLELLPKLNIADEFRHYPPEQLCSTSVALAVRKS
jgi:SAM-dependent methyltransferase